MTKFNRHRGFTLTEILVVMGIMLVLIGILVPVVVKARGKVGKARVAADLQAISTALEAYFADFRAYPPVISGDPTVAPATYFGTTGAHSLCYFLVGPGNAIGAGADGHDGYGIKGTSGTPVRGPYIQPDKFIIDDDADRATPLAPDLAVLRTTDGNPILYFPLAANRPNLSIANCYVTSRTIDPPTPATRTVLIQADDNLRYFADSQYVATGALPAAQQSLSLNRIRIMLGDGDMNGTLNAGETAIGQPYVLWATGEDDQFGPITADRAGVNACDDVTNFTFAP